MSQRRPTCSRILGRLLLPVQLDADAAGLRDGRGKYCLGFGIGTVGAIPALGCLLACQANDARW